MSSIRNKESESDPHTHAAQLFGIWNPKYGVCARSMLICSVEKHFTLPKEENTNRNKDSTLLLYFYRWQMNRRKMGIFQTIANYSKIRRKTINKPLECLFLSCAWKILRPTIANNRILPSVISSASACWFSSSQTHERLPSKYKSRNFPVYRILQPSTFYLPMQTEIAGCCGSWKTTNQICVELTEVNLV